MTTQPTERTLTALWITVGVGYALAAAVLVVRLVGSDLPVSLELPGAIAHAAIAATPPTLALLGLRGRPVLLLSAGLMAVTSLPVLSILGLVMFPLGIAWFLGYAALRTGGSIGWIAVTTILVWLLWVGAASVLFVHLDPRCAQTLTDGTVRQVDAISRGFDAGWIWEVDKTITGSSTGTAEVVEEVCVSDVVTGGEALIGLALVAASLGTGWWLSGSNRVAE